MLNSPAAMLNRLALSLILAAGCGGIEYTVPEPGSGTDGGAGISPGTGGGGAADLALADAGGGGSGGAGGAGGSGGANGSCDAAQSTASLGINANGHHNAGENCGNCHTAGKYIWTVAGTLYSSVDGSTPVAGATIHVTDANNKSITIVTANNGNFWTPQALTPPYKVSASLCPSTVKMASQATAFCNSCHGSGFRVHLP
jgi:hypothetical protein